MPTPEDINIIALGGTTGLITYLLVSVIAFVTSKVVPGDKAAEREKRLLDINENLANKISEQTETIRQQNQLLIEIVTRLGYGGGRQ